MYSWMPSSFMWDTFAKIKKEYYKKEVISDMG
jgi:hypothetical protein